VPIHYDFASDNAAPAAPEAMAALARANRGFVSAYGSDATTTRAATLIRELIDADAVVRFLSSGTAANAIACAMLARPFETVLAFAQAHVVNDEAGAPGLFGHGLGMTPLAGTAGRIEAAALATALSRPDTPHHQPPGALSLTNATEYGACYTNDQVDGLVATAREAGLGIHLDGARLANAAAAGFDLRRLGRSGVDIIILGGTKAGLPAGEAMIILDRALERRLDARLKQAGQLASKARFLSAPFVGMLEDGAMLRHAAHANAMASRLAAAMPFPLVHPVETNIVFAAIDDSALRHLHAAGWLAYRAPDGSVRFVCSWATTAERVDELAEALCAARDRSGQS